MAVAATLDQLQARRAELLVDGDDKSLDVVEKNLVQAQRQADRLDILTVQAEERLTEVVERERRAELDAVVADGEKLVSEAVALIRQKYPPMASKLLQLATRIEAIDDKLSVLNRRLAEAGDARRLPDPDEVARPGEPADLAWSATSMRQRFWRQLALLSAHEWYRMQFPVENTFGRPLRPDEGVPDR